MPLEVFVPLVCAALLMASLAGLFATSAASLVLLAAVVTSARVLAADPVAAQAIVAALVVQAALTVVVCRFHHVEQ